MIKHDTMFQSRGTKEITQESRYKIMKSHSFVLIRYPFIFQVKVTICSSCSYHPVHTHIQIHVHICIHISILLTRQDTKSRYRRDEHTTVLQSEQCILHERNQNKVLSVQFNISQSIVSYLLYSSSFLLVPLFLFLFFLFLVFSKFTVEWQHIHLFCTYLHILNELQRWYTLSREGDYNSSAISLEDVLKRL